MNSEEPSFLTHFSQLRLSSKPEGGISVLIYCGNFNGDIDVGSVLQVQRTVVENEVDASEGNITGILMAQGNSILHLIEGRSESVLNILSNLSKEPHFLTGVQAGRVVLSLEDQGERRFPEWYSCVLQDTDSNSENSDVDPYASIDLAHNLFEVGKKLQTESAEEVELHK